LKPLTVTSFTTVNALGEGNAAILVALRGRRSGLRRNDFESASIDTWIGRVEGIESAPLPPSLSLFECRNNRLAVLGLRQDGFEQAVGRARERYGDHRIAVLIGTSTSGVRETERAYAERDAVTGALPPSYHYSETHNLFSVCEVVRRYLGLSGPSATISTACSSSAKVFASAQRLIDAGFADAAVVGGVDSLCLMTLYGFQSLGLLSREPSRPCDEARDGISIGEAAGFALLERSAAGRPGVGLIGYGESSDAYHMSAPHPEGAGAIAAMRDALARAQIGPGEVDYVNMHGTGTPANDRTEDMALHRVFGGAVTCSSTKGWTGHTLGAAGIVEAVISLLCLQEGFVPGNLNVRKVDPALKSRIAVANEERKLRHVVSNSFGFGGNNCSLVFGRLV